MVASELTHAFRDNGFVKKSNGALGGGDFYSGRVADIKREFIRVEAGSNTSTVALRVLGGIEKGSLESETVKYGSESHRTRIRE
jgi:hypothetical protein